MCEDQEAFTQISQDTHPKNDLHRQSADTGCSGCGQQQREIPDIQESDFTERQVMMLMRLGSVTSRPCMEENQLGSRSTPTACSSILVTAAAVPVD